MESVQVDNFLISTPFIEHPPSNKHPGASSMKHGKQSFIYL